MNKKSIYIHYFKGYSARSMHISWFLLQVHLSNFDKEIGIRLCYHDLAGGKEKRKKTDYTVLQAGIRTVHKTIPHTEAPRGKAYFFATPFPELPRESANGTIVPMALCFSRHGLF